MRGRGLLVASYRPGHCCAGGSSLWRGTVISCPYGEACLQGSTGTALTQHDSPRRPASSSFDSEGACGINWLQCVDDLERSKSSWPVWLHGAFCESTYGFICPGSPCCVDWSHWAREIGRPTSRPMPSSGEQMAIELQTLELFLLFLSI